MSRIFRTTVVGMAIPVLLLATAHAAQAERWHGTDPAGDVIGTTYDPAPAPCGTFTDIDGSTDTNDDITGVTVRHTRKIVETTVEFQDIDPTREQLVSIHLGTTLARGWSVEVDRFQANPAKPSRVTTFISREPKLPETTDVPDDPDGCGYLTSVRSQSCRHLHTDLDLDLDRVQVSVPRVCLRNPPWVRAGVTSTGFINGEDQTFSAFYDWWGTPEEGESSWLPPFSPPVHAAPGAQNGAPSNRSRVTNSDTSLRRSLVSTLTGLPSGSTAATAY